MAKYQGWRMRVAITFYFLTILSMVLCIERLVFDVFGQMWGAMLVNGMNCICTLIGILGVCVGEKIGIGVYIFWSIISIGLNVIIVLIYQDVGLLSQKEHYLGLALGNDNWWRTHGINCDVNTQVNSTFGYMEETVGGNGGGRVEPCVLSYADIETIHAAVYMFIAAISVILGFPLICKRQKKSPSHSTGLNENEEDFSFVNIAQWYDYPHQNRHNRWQQSLGTNRTIV